MVFALQGVNKTELDKIKKFLINPVESREGSFDIPLTLASEVETGGKVETVKGFIDFDDTAIAKYHASMAFAMSIPDLKFVREYFKNEKRDPTITELKVIDTYWSDHCRHTTFLTELTDVKIESKNPHIENAYKMYGKLFDELYASRPDKYKCLMDIATIAVKKLKKEGKLDFLDVSDEINACSVNVTVDNNGTPEEWLIMYKNETHNHPTEIEPFGGAATCLGGAIRDPLSGRSYVYQAMRVTGSADPRESLENTLEGKLPQRVITTTAAAGFSSYGNQIGLATGIVSEMYHENFKAKRLETGYVIGGAPKENIVRECPECGDIVILLGGDTGRDGCGGATGSSKAHDSSSIEKCGAEVQKGNPLTERKIQRLFRNPDVSKMIIRCNDFGAGGVSVAIGELADGLVIDLDKVPKKYEGLNGTELSISESQERMAVVIKPENVKKFVKFAREENLNSAVVAEVTDKARMQMKYKGKLIVDISREFLNTNGVKQTTSAIILDKSGDYFGSIDKTTKMLLSIGRVREALLNELSRLNVCSNKGLSERFDSTIGASTILLPWGGRYQLTPSIAMASKPPVQIETDTATISAYGCNPYLMESDGFIGAIYSVVISLSKLIATGAKLETITLSLQEFFKKLGNSPERWGEPLRALLGAFYAQTKMDIGAIGGKDSMSGSFNNLDVPNTLIAFGMGIGKASTVLTNTFLNKGKLVWLPIKRDNFNVPDFDYLKKLYKKINIETEKCNILHMTVVEEGGLATAAIKSSLGDGMGLEFYNFNDDYLKAYFGDILAVVADEKIFEGFDATVVARVSDTPKFLINDSVMLYPAAEKMFTSSLEKIFPTTVHADGYAKNVGVSYTQKKVCEVSVSKPRVFIPVFPGTNCEYDTARAFKKAGAKIETLVIKNQNEADITEAVEKVAKSIRESQIIAFPGGFSGGDEPDGSGKFIATTFRNPIIAEALMELLYNRDGLILGICNGFQALIKLGLVPFGKILEQTASSPTLTYNNISRHVSTIARVRVASNRSPWLNNVTTGDIFAVPVSHGEGRFIAPKKILEALITNGQIATQYVDLNGNATMDSPYNPNGSTFAVEGITSPDGRIFGKMGHSERIGKNLYKNYPFNFDMKIFESGVKYFK
ncbi:MAG: phosphoribosylformylglycinamidine synthase [Clostridia bacterium]